MKRVAVLMAQGYEEGETLTIVDLLRRANIECHTFGFGEEFVDASLATRIGKIIKHRTVPAISKITVLLEVPTIERYKGKATFPPSTAVKR